MSAKIAATSAEPTEEMCAVVQVQGLQSKLGDSQSRIAQLEAAEAPLLEEISYLRGLVAEQRQRRVY